MTLDRFIDIEQCNSLKIDVELMEINVLKGAKILLKVQTNHLDRKSSRISKF